MSYYDRDARMKKQQEKDAEMKVLTDQRKAYVDSKKESLISEAAAEIRSAQDAFQAEAKNVANDLRDHLEKDVATPLNSAFLHFSKVFNDYGIPMTDLDIDVLFTFAQGNPTALRIIDSLITKTGSFYDIHYKPLSEYASDLRTIDGLAKDDAFACPLAYMHEMVDIFSNSPIWRDQDEEFANTRYKGQTFNQRSLSSSGAMFSAALEKLECMTSDEEKQFRSTQPWNKEASFAYSVAKETAAQNKASKANVEATKAGLDAYMH